MGERELPVINIGNNKLSMFFANVQSLRAKFDELYAFVEDSKPAVVGITETWLNEDFSDAEFSIPGYVMYRQDRTDTYKGRGGGVLLYVNTTLNSIERSDLHGDFVNSVWCQIPVGTVRGSPLVIGVVYKSPNSSRANESLLFNVLKVASVKDVIIMGDFNYPNINWDDGVFGSRDADFYEVLQDCFLHQHVSFPTRGENILDLVLCNVPNMVDNVGSYGKLGNSDHESVGFDVVVGQPFTVSKEVVPNYSRADIEGISCFLSSIDWVANFHGLNSSACWALFLDKINYVVQHFVPVTNRRSKARRPPWMSKAVMCEIRKKRKLWRIYKFSQTDDAHDRFNSQVTLVRRLISSAKFSFEKKLASNIKDNPKAFFGYVRSKQRVRDTVGPLRNMDASSLVNDKQEMADILNEFFASVFVHEEGSQLVDILGGENDHSLNSVIFTECEVEKKLGRLGLTKSPGPDAVHPFLLKSFASLLACPISIIFQRSFDEGVVPSDWKCANVTPIFKKGDRSQAGNYRPISLTSVICKVMESIVKDAIVRFFDDHSVINSTQHGFTKNRSCLTNILEFLEDVTYSVDCGKPVDVVFLDFQKAFDKVPHNKLLCKLKGLGIKGGLLKWIGDWLDSRKQRVVLGGSVSSWKSVSSGVPQGSVLGPLLFVAYINDLDDCIGSSSVKKFADDTKVYREICTKDDAAHFQRDLDNIFNWSKDWGMFFNVDKCKVMHVGYGNASYPYNINGRNLQVVEREKDLGVYLDSSMKPSKQCSEAARKGNWILGLIRRHFKFLHKDVVVRLYKQMVRPHLEYAIQAWNPFLSRDKFILEQVQRRATRLISSISDLPYEQRLVQLGLTTLELRRLRGDLIQVFKIVHGFDKLVFDDFFTLSHNTRTRGHGLKLHIHRSRLDVRKYFFSRRVVQEWNTLPAEVVYSSSVNAFKNGIDAHFSTSGRV